MEARQPVQDVLREQRSHLASEYGVTKLGLFGSCSRDSAQSESDVDVIVEFAEPLGLKFIDFAEELEQLLGRRVDVLTLAGLKEIRIRQVADEITQSVVYV
jgi:predicted nucleotidyltransferase